MTERHAMDLEAGAEGMRPNQSAAQPAEVPAVLTDEQIDILMPDPSERTESWPDQWGYEQWDYAFSREQVRDTVRAALAAAPAPAVPAGVFHADAERFLRHALTYASGWDDDGALDVAEPFSWETAARVAWDMIRAALNEGPAALAAPPTPPAPAPAAEPVADVLSALPPLPEPEISGYTQGRPGFCSICADGYTADQMREYARAALAAPQAEPLTDEAVDALLSEWANAAGLLPDFIDDMRADLRQLVRAAPDWAANRLPGARARLASTAPPAPQEPSLPEGWVPLTMEWEPGYPEDVAFGPQRMMDRLKKWLDKHFARVIAERHPGVLTDALQALDRIDDFIARCNGDDRGACESVNIVRAALASTAPPAPHADALRALVQQIESNDFRDSLGHAAKMLKPFLDAKNLLGMQ
jgi:hypothetical protein